MFDLNAYPFDPTRPHPPQPLYHRWRRCVERSEAESEPSAACDDAVTIEGWRYLRTRQGHSLPDYGRSFILCCPWIYEADQGVRYMEVLKRGELQARLLAGESDETIAAKCGMSAEGVKAFHDLFFDVRPHLGSVNTIASTALRCCVDMESDHHDSILLVFGYGLGGRAVDGLLDYFANPPPMRRSRRRPEPIKPKRLCWQGLVELAVRAMAGPHGESSMARQVQFIVWLREFAPVLVAEGGGAAGPPDPRAVAKDASPLPKGSAPTPGGTSPATDAAGDDSPPRQPHAAVTKAAWVDDGEDEPLSREPDESYLPLPPVRPGFRSRY